MEKNHKNKLIAFNAHKLAILLGTIILLGLLYQPVFGHLDRLPIRKWDESRLAVNAYEMYKDGDAIVTHYNQAPDMWNTKPPLMIWQQALCMKIFGPGEFAVRLPSAIAALLTCCFLLFFCTKYLKNYWLGFMVALFLITAGGYVRMHGTRTGDYDAMLTFFTTVSYLCFFIFLETEQKKYLYAFFVGLALAVLTKSITGLIFLPAVFLYCLFQKKLLFLLKSKDFYIGLGIFLFLTLGYYLLRETLNPGYIKAVSKNELGGRFLNVIENHGDNNWYFFDQFFKHKKFAFPWMIVFGLLAGFLTKNKLVKRMTLFTLLLVVTFTLFISLSKTKLSWYDLPLYPFLSIFAGLFCFAVFDLIAKIPASKHRLAVNIFPFVFLFLVFNQPYKKIFDQTNAPKENAWDMNIYRVSYLLRDGVEGKIDLSGYTLLSDGYEPHYLFYLKLLQDKGVSIKQIPTSRLTPRDNVITCAEKEQTYIKQNFDFEITYQDKNLIIYNIAKKEQEE